MAALSAIGNSRPIVAVSPPRSAALQSPAVPEALTPATAATTTADNHRPRFFRRIARLLRPQWGTIAVAVALLLLSLPAELFPGLTWLYVTDRLILNKDTRAVTILNYLFSFNGHLTDKIHLLISSVGWMFGVYLVAELFGTLSTVLMSIVAQRFTLMMRNAVYHKLQSQSLAYMHRQRIGDLMSR